MKRNSKIEEVINCFNQKKADEIDRHIFMKNIIDYLEIDIDQIRNRNKLKRPSLSVNFEDSLPSI